MLVFLLDQSPAYKINFERYSGPPGVYDCLLIHHQLTFKDKHTSTGMPLFKANWWDYFSSSKTCCNLNGLYRNNGEIDDSNPQYNIYWNSFKSGFEPLKYVRMSVL